MGFSEGTGGVEGQLPLGVVRHCAREQDRGPVRIVIALQRQPPHAVISKIRALGPGRGRHGTARAGDALDLRGRASGSPPGRLSYAPIEKPFAAGVVCDRVTVDGPCALKNRDAIHV